MMAWYTWVAIGSAAMSVLLLIKSERERRADRTERRRSP